MAGQGAAMAIIGLIILGFVGNLLCDFLDKAKYKHLLEKTIYASIIVVATATIVSGITSVYRIIDVIR